jgi:hypothetical protein
VQSKAKAHPNPFDEFAKKAVSEAHGFMQECEAYCQKKGVKASYKVVHKVLPRPYLIMLKQTKMVS